MAWWQSGGLKSRLVLRLRLSCGELAGSVGIVGVRGQVGWEEGWRLLALAPAELCPPLSGRETVVPTASWAPALCLCPWHRGTECHDWSVALSGLPSAERGIFTYFTCPFHLLLLFEKATAGPPFQNGILLGESLFLAPKITFWAPLLCGPMSWPGK